MELYCQSKLTVAISLRKIGLSRRFQMKFEISTKQLCIIHIIEKFGKLFIMTKIVLSLLFALITTISFSINNANAKKKEKCETHTMYPLGKQRSCKRHSRRLAEIKVSRLCATGSRKKYTSQMIGGLKKITRSAGPRVFTVDANGKREPLILELCGATWKVCVTC